jgi:hypothetical protein
LPAICSRATWRQSFLFVYWQARVCQHEALRVSLNGSEKITVDLPSCLGQFPVASDDTLPMTILSLRNEIAELGGAIRQLQRSGLDSAAAQLLISRKRGELKCLLSRNRGNGGK